MAKVLFITIHFLTIVSIMDTAEFILRNKDCPRPTIKTKGDAYFDGDPLIVGVKTGYSIDMKCNERLFFPGKTRAKCLGHNKWSPLDPPCKRRQCPQPVVPTDIFMDIKGRYVDNEAIYSCRKGYWYTGDKVRVCQVNETWSGNMGRCSEIRCPPITEIPNGKVGPSSVATYGTRRRLSITCNHGYAYVGSYEVVCQDDNKWAGNLGTCVDVLQVFCEPFITNEHTIVKPCNHKVSYRTVVEVSCVKGYKYNGSRTRRCQADGKWSGRDGVCRIHTCSRDVFTKFNNEEITTCDSCTYGTKLFRRCPETNTHGGIGLTCGEDGQWTGTLGSCIEPDCLPIKNVEHGRFIAHGYLYNDSAVVKCDEGYSWQGQHNITCVANNTWAIKGSCEELSTGQLLESWNGYAVVSYILLALLVIVCMVIVFRWWKRKRSQLRNRPKKTPEEGAHSGLDKTNKLLEQLLSKKSDDGGDDEDDDDEYPDVPPFPLPPLPKEIQDTLKIAPTKGHLICKSSGPLYNDIAWFNDGSLLAGEYHGKAAWRISFSPDYSHVTTRRKLHSGAPARRVSTSPDGGWAFCDSEDSLYICNPGEEEATLWDPGFKVWKVTLTSDRIILGSARTIHIYTKNKDVLYEKEISSEIIQFMAYNRQTNTMVFTAGTKGDPSYLYVTSLNTDSPVYRIKRFSQDNIKFKYPLGLCTDQSCNIYVPDHDANAIFVFDRVGRFLHKLDLDKPRLLKPWSLSILEQPDKPPILAVDDDRTSTIYLYKLS